ncbi:serine/threonine-protein kinase [Sorangium cellulosum]|uniref:serine/threonine-protein kinase n=1 Tax=Sorangium cellulosum TaxID=56 RepID=UPI0009B8580D|nr:serine/threonine-protein kinase [Sorangium cellulosum]
MSSDTALQRVGTTIRNKWTLERLLGAGGMAAVYVGVHRIGRRDALKILHPQAAQSKEICDRFEREAQAANRFRHPGAVEIRDIDVAEDGAPFLVMELLEGESLAERERRLGGLPLAEVLGFAAQVLDTLGAAHAQGIIHRDIKPPNLYVVREAPASTPAPAGGPRIKVLDFGLARIRQDSGLLGELTRMGLVLGTTPYMPPEQAKGRDIDFRADLFAVGATMFRLIAGRHVHEASTDFDLLLKMGREPAPPLSQRAPYAPRDVCLVVDRALAFDRDQRYPDAHRMLEDVLALLRREPPPYASRFAHAVDPDAITLHGQRAPAAPDDENGPITVPVGPASSPTAIDSIAVEWSDEPPVSGGSITTEWERPAGANEESIAVEWSDESPDAPASQRVRR